MQPQSRAEASRMRKMRPKTARMSFANWSLDICDRSDGEEVVAVDDVVGALGVSSKTAGRLVGEAMLSS